MHRRRTCLLTLAITAAAFDAASAQTPDQARWQQEAAAVTITRDNWGIAHIHGHTDADAVFGTIYAQCEDDFPRVEHNYLVSLGRLAEAEGPSALWQDLRQRLFLDPADLQRHYRESPPWLQALMNAWADGLNFYLAQHPEVHPEVLTHFEPWMALSFTEGSIGGDIEHINLDALRAFYDHPPTDPLHTSHLPPNNLSSRPTSLPTLSSRPERSAVERPAVSPVRHEGWRDKPDHAALTATLDPLPLSPEATHEPSGSNGFAIAPANTRDHHALLLINPHTTFFFRSELQMTSDRGLNAYGAVTWGQFFIYQGFNDRAGWMHTSSQVDAVDEYTETVFPQPGHAFAFRYGAELRPFTTTPITLRYKTPEGLQTRTFTTYANLRGPVIRQDGDHWITIRLMNTPIPALEQSFLRTKARTYAEYRQTMEIKANSSNNTVFADADGDIAYWNGDFIPLRDPHFDYTHPVDGTDPAVDWHGLLILDQVPHLLNPGSGYIENVNNSPWSGSGASSLHKADFPAYVDSGTETARGLHAIRVLDGHHDFTLDSLLTAAFDPYLPWFARTVPVLLQAYDALPPADPQRAQLAPQIAALRSWNFQWGLDSVPTTLAITWGELVGTPVYPDARRAGALWEDFVATDVPPQTLLAGLAAATAKLTTLYGTWQKPWGQINRFQRLDDSLEPHFSDAAPSIPVPFVASQWGSLAAFVGKTYPDTKLRYGNYGNTFVAVVEFGPRVHARAVTVGGESGHPGSPHFNDQATRYSTGNLRDVYFYPDELAPHTERTYHPGH